MSVILGEATEQNFDEAVDSAEETYGEDSCGARIYTIVERGDLTYAQVPYARVETVTFNQEYKIVSDYDLEDYEGVHDLDLYVTLVNYPTEDLGSHPTLLSPFTLTIQAATCDCSLLVWTLPDDQSLYTTVLKSVSDTLTISHAVVDETSKTTTPPIRACYRDDLGPATPCDETTAITSIVYYESTGVTAALPSILDWQVDDITVNAVSNDEARDYQLVVTHSTPDNGDIVFENVLITIGVCVIEEIHLPTNPGAQEYYIHALSDVTINLSTPGFQQFPACGYTLDETFTWVFDPVDPHPNAIVTQTSVNPYIMQLTSTTNSDAGTWTATLMNDVVYQSDSWLVSISFDVTIVDPCMTTVLTSFSLTDMQMECGQTITQQFLRPDDTAEVAVSSPDICGPRTYEVVYADD